MQGEARGDDTTITAEKIVIATGTKPARPVEVDSDGVLRIPRSMVVVGAGVIGIEYASMFAALGTRVTVVERNPQMLGFCDPEMVESLTDPATDTPQRATGGPEPVMLLYELRYD